MNRPGTEPSPPTFTRGCLRLLLPSDVVGETILGDLDEEYREIASMSGLRRARAWYRRQARRVVVDYVVLRWVRRADAGRPASRPTDAPGRRNAFEIVAMDTRHAIRALRREPGLFATVVVVLALGIGANTAVFSVVQAVLLEPLPYPTPDRVVRVRQTLPRWANNSNPILAGMADDFPVEWGVAQDWERHNNSFEAMGVYRGVTQTFAGPLGPELLDAAQASFGAFTALGVRPALGRLFSPEDDLVGGERTVILSHSFWTTAYGGDPGAVGGSIVLTGVPHRIIGIMPRGFYFPTRATTLWTRLEDRYLQVYEGGQSLTGLARLKPSVSLTEARRDMDRVTGLIVEERPGRGNEDGASAYGVKIMAQHEYLVGDVQAVLALLLAAVGTVLLIACANASGLMLIRAARRRQELSVRTSLGAGRGRILGQLLTESVLLAVVAGAAALVVTALTGRLLVSMMPAGIPRVEGVHLNTNVLGFSIVVTLGCGLVVGVLPALRASRTGATSILGSEGRWMTAGRKRLRMQRTLVVAEIALTVPLVVAAGLLAGSLSRMTTTDLGIDPTGVHTVRISPFGERYDSDDEERVLHDAVRERLRAIPGVLQVAGGEGSPYSEGGSGGNLRIGDGEDAIVSNVKWTNVQGSFFSLLGIPIIRGRPFLASDGESDENVAIINQAMARQFWPTSDPLGEVFYRGGEEDVGLLIVGIVGNVKRGSPAAPASPLVYLPSQSITRIFVRSAGDIVGLQAATKRIMGEIDPGLPFSVTPMVDEVRGSTADARFRALLISLFAALAATLALVGVGGILSYTVTQQRREIGLRMAVGATSGRVMRGVLSNGMKLIAVGLVIGGVVTAVTVRLIQTFLFETSATDPSVLIGTTALLVTAGLAVSLLPAQRAASVDPGTVLNAD